jgi:hypothetical protein
MPVEAPLEFIPAPVNTVRDFKNWKQEEMKQMEKPAFCRWVFGLHIMPVDCQRFEKV